MCSAVCFLRLPVRAQGQVTWKKSSPMKGYVWPVLSSILFSSPTYALPAVDEPKKAEMYGETGRCHDKSGKAHGPDEHAVSRVGQPGKASRVARTIRMQALDKMRYAPG